MRYSTEPKFRKYVKGYGFCHLQENLVINMVKNSWIVQKKTGIDAAKTASKIIVQKNCRSNRRFDRK